MASLDDHCAQPLEHEAYALNNQGEAGRPEIRHLCKSIFREFGTEVFLGAYVRVKGGIRKHTRDYPELTKLLTRFLSQEFPGDSFLAISLALDKSMEPHKDLQNSTLPSLLCNVSDESLGGTWIEHPEGKIPRRCQDGKTRLGCVYRGHRYRLSASKLWHAPFTEGEGRIMLIGWVPAGWQCLSPEDLRQLHCLGFRRPGPDAEATSALSLWRGTGLVQTDLHRFGKRPAHLGAPPSWRLGQLKVTTSPLHICMSSDEEAEDAAGLARIDGEAEFVICID
ncbi:unnamed protein product [Symbiodinium sp. CCMP2592]|nr:unnamed protein product [Symbiodinium sp. CCMP2592]